MTTKIVISIPLLLAAGVPAAGQAPEPVTAREALVEAGALCAADRGRLWGRDLCGPIMIVEPAARAVVANEADPQGSLTKQDGAHRGVLPPGIGIANTAITWQGRRWTMLRSPLPADPTDRAILLMHESWHRIQGDLGLTGREAAQAHLVTPQGRIALRLELRALAAAVELKGRASRRALEDALAFRTWRYAKFPSAQPDEAALELNEGLAEYTGWQVAGAAANRARLARHIRKGDRPGSLVRSFAYFTGPAYGSLLDRLEPDWKSGLSERPSLSEAVPGFADFPTVSDAELEKRGARYDMAKLRSEELEAARVASEARARWRAQLIDGPTLTIPMLGAGVVFDPNTVFPLDDLGNVYPRLQANAVWGTLDATEGVLLRGDWSAMIVTAADIVTEGQAVSGRGWRLALAHGWSVKRGADGFWRFKQSPSAKARSK